MTKNKSKERGVDYRFLETLGYLANDSTNKKFSEDYFKERGLLSAINALVDTGMVDKSSKSKDHPYSINERGRLYAKRVLEEACKRCNSGSCTFIYKIKRPYSVPRMNIVDVLEASKVKIYPINR